MLTEKLVADSKPGGMFSFSTSLNVLVPVLLTALLNFMLMTDESKEPITIMPEVSAVAAIDTEKTEESVALLDIESGNSSRTVAAVGRNNTEAVWQKQESIKLESEYQGAGRVGRQHLPAVDGLSMDIFSSIMDEREMDVEVKRVRIPKKAKENNISRRQQRMIEKKKGKALQERQAREFMKGNVPYVVPLNSQNF